MSMPKILGCSKLTLVYRCCLESAARDADSCDAPTCKRFSPAFENSNSGGQYVFPYEVLVKLTWLRSVQSAVTPFYQGGSQQSS
jgi:hypothetical protein